MRMPVLPVAILTLATGALVGCGAQGDQAAMASPAGGAAGLATGDKAFPMPAPHSCELVQLNEQSLPDPHCTPGAVDPAVSQANLTDTICKSDWREKAYPAVEVDNQMKEDSARSYGLPVDFEGEYDHLVSRMLGGSSEDPRNRWPQPQAKPNPKDRIEIALHEGVCKGMIPLAVAQRALATSWVTAAEQAGLQLIGDPNKPVEQSRACLRGDPLRCTSLHKAYDD